VPSVDGGAAAISCGFHDIKFDGFRLMDGLPGAIPLGYIPPVENLLAD
jgi:hypothetical protein